MDGKGDVVKRRINPLGWSWSGFDLLLVIGALLAGFLIWFVPNLTDTPEMRAFYARQKELKTARLAVEAEEARVKKEQEELGLVFIAPPPPEKKNR